MDEPLSNLDAELRVHMRAEIAQLHRRLAHDLHLRHARSGRGDDDVGPYCRDDGGRGAAGCLAQGGLRGPERPAVARFVGSPAINVLPGIVEAAGSIDVLGGSVAAADGTCGRHARGYRPPGRRLSRSRPSGRGGDVTGRMVHVENLGSDLFLHAAVEGVAAPIVVRGTIPGSPTFQRSAILSASPCRPARILVFDSAGRRVARQASASPTHAHA